MRFMMLMKPNLPAETDEEGWMPPLEAVEAMMRYNDELTRAGVLLALDGLYPPASAVQVSFSEGKAKVTDGPFTEAKELIGGYWVIDVKSRAEAVEWATRCPVGDSDAVIEVRQIFEMSDFPPALRAAAQGEDAASS